MTLTCGYGCCGPFRYNSMSIDACTLCLHNHRDIKLRYLKSSALLSISCRLLFAWEVIRTNNLSEQLTIFPFLLARALRNLVFTPSTAVDGEAGFAKDED